MSKVTRSLVTILNITVGLLLLLAYLGAFVSPVHINFISFLGFGFPFFWVLNLICVIYWLLKRRKRLLFSLVLIVISWWQWHAVFQLQGEQNIDRKKLNNPATVMSYNVRMFDRYVWTGDHKTPQKIYEFIRKENPDILCIQEFFVNNQKQPYSENNILSKFKQFRYKHIEYIAESKSGRKYGLATFSKFPIIDKKPLYFKNTTNFSIQTDINVNGSKVRVFNNHLESIRLQRENYNFIDSLEIKNNEERRKGIYDIFGKLSHAFATRSLQAETIGRHVQNSPFPTIVCGDFNDTPVSYVYKQVKGNLKDSFIQSGKGFGGTYHGNLPSFRIDFIFHDSSYKSYNFKRYKVDYSDHYPIKSLIELSPDK